ncbi:hypothetical protein XELAEV_18043748mg [Xenopus laevis]|uniref:Uncharacterized protein n=1 Tax=Xenopus laevis TaxID=8355 RepID=A0A974BXI9_XENLA|nr:hypothetical protein XELAEV_18043748mg [Xenopus laevis]
MALPDLQLYYLAAQLSQLWTLKHSSAEEALYQLWQSILQTELPPIHSIITIALKNSRPAHNPLLIHQKGVLNRVHHLTNRVGLDPLIPLWYNSKLAPLDKLIVPKAWLDGGIYTLDQVWGDYEGVSFSILKERHAIPSSQWLTYHNIIGTVRKALKPNNYRLPSTPVKLHSYWVAIQARAIQARITKLLGFKLPLDPKWYPLFMAPPTALTTPARKMVNQLLFLARNLIALNWKASLRPTYQAWEKAVQDLQKVEDLIARRNGTSKHYIKICQLWILENA